MKKILRSFAIIFLFIIALPNKGLASHIVGGALTYTYNGGNNYTIQLKLYRDCSGIAFPATVTVGVLYANGNSSLTLTMPGGAITNVPPVLPPCATSPSVVPCVQERIYTTTVNILPTPGGAHLVHGVCCRNPSISNIVNPVAAGETFYAYIPHYNKSWVEDFTLANGTTVDNGPTSWSISTTSFTPVPTAQVNNGEYEVISQNSGTATTVLWSSQVINISTFTAGVNLSVNYSEPTGNTLENSDSIKVMYSINGGPKVIFPFNGQAINDFNADVFSYATGLVGNTIQIFVRCAFGANSPNDEMYQIDAVSVYDGTFLPNSNPAFTQLPPLLFCATNNFTLNNSAADLDGDVLVYSMYTPLNDAPAPTFVNNIFSVATVTWVAGYSATSPFNSGGPGVTLNPTTGMMTGVANSLGQFVFGVKCQEYRNGVLLSESFRDYQVNTVTCPPFIPSAPNAGANTPLCVGQTLSLTASFTAGATYSWTGPNGFTSTLQNPTVAGVTTLATGVYSVTATISGCTGPPGTVAVTVNTIPANPVTGANTPICAGQTLSLTASFTTGATYNWTGPNSFVSALQNPTIGGITLAASGTYSVTGTIAGCTGQAGTVAVVVNPIPSAPILGANTPLCAGQTLNLTSTFTTGATYSWTGPNSFTANVQNPSIAGVTTAGSGIYSVTATSGGCAGPTATISVTVNSAPSAPVTGANTPLCVGQTLSLTASFTTGATYAWSGPNGFSSSSQNPTLAGVTLAAGGTYSVIPTLAGCPGPAGTVAVVVNPIPSAPTAGANTPLCTGQTLSLTSTFTAGASYNWSGPNSFTANTQNPTLAGTTPAATGLYSVSATVAGCTGPIGTVSVNVSNQPLAPNSGANSPLCVGQTLSLTATFTAGLSYTWNGPNGFSSSLQNPTIPSITMAGAGTYSVFATTAGGCVGLTGTLAVTVNGTPAAPTVGANTPICAGQTLSLTSTFTSGATYSWTGPNSFSSTLQNPTIAGITSAGAGTYSVNATIAGCPGPNGTVAVVVNPIPAAPAPGSNSPLCAGQNLNLTSTFTAGASYNWSGPNSFTSNVQNPTITGITLAGSGVYSVNATILGCSGPAGTVSVTVNPIPATPVPNSNSPICSGQTLSLSVTPVSGATYSWTGPNTFNSTLQNPTIAGATTLAAGNYSLGVTVLGCTSAKGTVSVTVNQTPAAPTAGGTATLCAGSNINLTANPGGASYNWTGPNAFTSTLQNPTITGASTLATGMYSVTATVGGCTGPAGTFSVNVFGIPSPPNLGNNSPVCTGQNLTFTAATIAGASYAWTGPNGFSSALQNPTITNVTTAAAGNYTLAVNVSGCGSAATLIAVTVNTTPAAPVTGANAPICVGQNLNLTSTFTSGATYSWTGPNSFTSNVQNPTINGITIAGAGTYSVNATMAGCTGPNGTIAVAVNTIPASPTAGSNGPLCAGQNLNLTSTFTTGATYVWSGPNSFTSNVQNPTITGITLAGSGVYTVNATMAGCTGPAGTVSVTVNPIPATPVPNSNSPICSGQTLSLSVTPVSGATYSWTGPNSFNSTSQNPTIVGASTLAAGNYSLAITVLGCASAKGTVSVIINQTPNAPTAGGTATLCEGSNINLTANPGGASYSWTGPNGFTSTLQNPSITGASSLATGMYSVTATLNGCTGPAGTFSVNVYGIPSAPSLGNNSPICTGQNLTFTAATIAGASYAWTGPNGFTSALQNPTITNVTTAAAGNYSLAVNVSGCGSASTLIAVTVNTTPAAPVPNSNSPICSGQNLNLTSNPSGSIYSWTGPNSFTSTAQNPSITGATTLASGSYSVTQTVAGCVSPAGILSVTINPIPNAPVPNSNSPICAGQNLNLSVTFTAGTTYSWTGPNSFTSSVQNPVIAGATTLATGAYSVSATVAGCTGAEGIISVTVNPIPAAPVVNSNSPLCAGQTISFTASGTTTYSWTGPNSFTSTSQSPTIATTSTLGSGNYTLTGTVLGCTSPATVINVVVNPSPNSPVPTANTPLCVNQTLSLTATTISGATYNWTGPNGFNSTSQNPTIPNATLITSGQYSVTSTAAGCTSSISVVNVTVTSPATITTGTSPTVCANNQTVNLNGTSTTGSGTWTAVGGSFSPNNLTGNFVPNGSQIASGVANLTLTSTNNGGCPSTSATMSVMITPAPTASAGANQSKCANNAVVVLNGAVTVASGGIWSSSGTGTFSPNNSALTASYAPSTADISAGSFTLTLTTSGNGNCIPVTSSMVVNITPAPVVNGGPANQFVCKNNPNYQLNATSSTGTASWTTSGTGTFSPNANVLNPIYFSSTADTTAGSITLTLTSTGNGGCLPVSQVINLIYTTTLTVNPGATQTVCANNSTVALNGISTTSAGVWSSSGTGTFTPGSTSLITSYVPSAADILAGAVTLTLTSANNGGCNPVTNTTSIIITPKPIANAGSNQTVCANNASVALNGSVTIATGGIWSSSGTGTFTPNNTSLSSGYIASAADTTAGSVFIILSTTGNGNCITVSDTMLLSFSSAPLVNAGVNASACKTNPNITMNGTSSTGSATWTTLGSGTFNPNNTVLSPTYIPSTADTTAGSVTLILTSINNGGCNPVSDTIVLQYGAPPTITAGVSQTVCANNANVLLNGLSSTGSATWTSSGTGAFAPNTFTGTYIPSSADISSGAITLTITSTNNLGCIPVTQQLNVSFGPAPTVSAGIAQTVCASAPTIAISGSVALASGGSWTSNGTGTFVPNNSSLNTNYIASSADTTAGNVTLYLTTTGNGNCNPVIDSLKITFISSPYVSAGSDITMCDNVSSVNLGGISSAGSPTWSTLGNGSFSPNTLILNPVYSPSSADTAAGSVQLVLSYTNAGGCSAVNDTLKINFQNSPKANFSFESVCLGAATSYTDMSSPGSGTIVSWSWNFGNDTSIMKDPIKTFTSPGNHTVSLLVSNGSCVDSIKKNVWVNSLPVANFSIAAAACGYTANFADLSTVAPGNINNWNWDFGDLGTSTIQNPDHIYADTGSYIVTFTVTSDSGCSSVYSDTMRVVKCANDITGGIGEPAVPTGFTPNGDGNNDILYVKGGPYNTLDFRIFNEWGQQIFQSTIQSTGWDGTFKSREQPVGAFVWTVDGELIDGRKIKMAGEVLLTR